MATKTITTIEEITFAQYVGRRIRHRRQLLGLTIRAVVADCDISQPFLSECENGKRSIGYRKVYCLAKVLRCSTDWFAKGWD